MVAVFVDRDGVINLNRPDYVRSCDDLELLPGAAEALARLSARGHSVFVITNQAAVGRGQLSLDEAESINEALVREVSAAGAAVEHTFMCCHRPEDDCHCRKPKPGLLHAARDQYGVDLDDAYLVGDHWTDIAAAEAAGCRSILVLSGRWRDGGPDNEEATAIVADDLSAAVDVILAETDGGASEVPAQYRRAAEAPEGRARPSRREVGVREGR